MVAQRINDLIGRTPAAKVAGLTSSFYRRRMSTLLSMRISAQTMTEVEFELLLDHRMGTSIARYHLEGDAEKLKI